MTQRTFRSLPSFGWPIARWWLLTGMLFIAGWMLLLWPSERASRTASTRLPGLAVRAEQVTVSGISSGAYMAGQFQLAHAEMVSGAGLIAGGPYGCAESAFSGMATDSGAKFLNASRAVTGCMLNNLALWGVPNPDSLAVRARQLSAEGRIGPVAAVATDRVYLFTGRADSIVRPPIVAAARRFYDLIGVPADQIRFVDTLDAGHAFITLDKGGACATSGAPYVVDCDYDQAGSLLQHLLGGAKTPTGPAAGMFQEFDQTPFTADLDAHGLASAGVVYVPPNCHKGGCLLHVAFHGCAQNRAAVGDAFVVDTGFAPWADANNLVVLFPEVMASSANPQGCWDWWGYTGRAYLTRDAPQIIAIHRMIVGLAARAGS
ncbi:MAG: PHB depolymerase family esterase [Hyphomicrobiaceae bacterium]|nr:PHB depolymerase family esterase [Hyphomicrobiaceae bacterium]